MNRFDYLLQKCRATRQALRCIPVALTMLLLQAAVLNAARIPIIDAHSQAEHELKLDKVITLMDKAGVTRTILAARRKTKPEDLLAFAARHPERITPALRTKSGHYSANRPKYYKFLAKQMKLEGFAAIAEVLMYHAEKINKRGKSMAPEVRVLPEDRRVQAALEIALRKGWPFVIHIEFASAGGDRAVFMEQMETMLRAHPTHPFALIHMGQLEAEEVGRLIEAHPNLHFLTAHATPFSIAKSREPWANMFEGKRLAPPWKALILRHPERFVMAFDNVWAKHWGKLYLKQVALWRKALGDLPPEVAHALAHRNAERLWKLPPAQ